MSRCAVCESERLTTDFGELCGACALRVGITDERDLIGDYERFDQLGEGGMGVVYLAKHVTSDELVALKLAKPELLAHPEGLRWFRRQARLESALKHPNIVHVQGAGVHDGQPFLVMPLMEGGTLADPENFERFASPQARLSLVLDIARALRFAHERGVLHCDLKPENILFDADFRPHVSDFGMARHIELSGAAEGPRGGTRGFMSPEQVRGEPLTTASDVFALGVLLHWLAHGELPFGGGDEFERRVLNDSAPALRAWSPELDWGLHAVTNKALQKEPASRYGSAAALVHDLERLAAQRAIRGQRLPFWGVAWHWAERHPGARNALFLLLPCFALATLFMANTQRAELRRAALDMNAYAASGQAATVLYQLREYADGIERAAADPAVRALVRGPRRVAAAANATGKDPCETQRALEDTAPLAKYAARFATMVVLDADGCPRARLAADSGSPEYIRTSQSWRNYFSSVSKDAARPGGTQVRNAYRSSVSQLIKFAVSTPLFDGEQWLGVVTGSITAAATLGVPRMKRTESKDQLTVLLGPFEGERPERGQREGEYTFLVHPQLASGQKVMLDAGCGARLKDRFRAVADARQFELATSAPLQDPDYFDPLLGGRWLAAFAPVGGTGYVVVVQTRDAVAIRPSNGLHRFGVGIAFGSGSLLALWTGFFLWRRARERAR